jgi:hypothetical protein
MSDHKTIDPKRGTYSQVPPECSTGKQRLARAMNAIWKLWHEGVPDGKCLFHQTGPCFHPCCMQAEGRRLECFGMGLTDE